MVFIFSSEDFLHQIPESKPFLKLILTSLINPHALHALIKGIPLEIERKGAILKIIPEKPVSKLDRLGSHDTIIGDPESIITSNWTEYPLKI